MLVMVGFVWIFLSAKLIQRVNRAILNTQIGLAIISIFYIGRALFKIGEIIFMDIFIIVALYGFLFYGLFFIRRLKIKK